MSTLAKPIINQAVSRPKNVKTALVDNLLNPCTIDDIAEDFAHATIEALRGYAREIRSYAEGFHKYINIVRQVHEAEVKIKTWDNCLQTLLAEFQDTSRLLAELQRRTDNIVANIASISIHDDVPDDCVLLFAKIDFDLMEDTANYAEYHADNFMILYPAIGCNHPCGYTQADRKRDERTAEHARQAAAKNKRELDAKSRGGKKGAKTRNEEAATDPTKETIRREVNAKKAEWDKLYPNRQKPGSKDHTDNQIYRMIAGKHPKADGSPYPWETIKSWYRPKRAKKNGNK